MHLETATDSKNCALGGTQPEGGKAAYASKGPYAIPPHVRKISGIQGENR